jgi:hypothetical protein
MYMETDEPLCSLLPPFSPSLPPSPILTFRLEEQAGHPWCDDDALEGFQTEVAGAVVLVDPAQHRHLDGQMTKDHLRHQVEKLLPVLRGVNGRHQVGPGQLPLQRLVPQLGCSLQAGGVSIVGHRPQGGTLAAQHQDAGPGAVVVLPEGCRLL